MRSKSVYASGAFLLFGCLVLLKALTNPRLRELRVVDSIQLVAVGLFVGVSIALVLRAVRTD